MNQIKTVENAVYEILRDCPKSRYDDMFLMLRYYEKFGNPGIGSLKFQDVVLNYKKYGLPCFESIRRSRQRVQSLFPELSRKDIVLMSNTPTIVINIG